MANKELFTSSVSKTGRGPVADTRNEAGGLAYSLEAEAALAQYICTGTLSNTYYASASDQLAKVMELATKVSDTFLAKAALYSRESSFMKDMPALLCAILATRNTILLKQVFSRAIDNGRMLRNFVQILRSGQVGRKSLGTTSKKLVQKWLDAKSDEYLFRSSVGNDPSLADVIKMVHPKPKNETRKALYAYLIGRPHVAEMLPAVVQEFERFKKDPTDRPAPNVEFRMLTSLPLTEQHWKDIATKAGWTMTRMNLNTFARNGVFKDKAMVEMIANRLRDPEQIAKAMVFPYQLLMAFKASSLGTDVPVQVTNALQDAMEIAVNNVPDFGDKTVVVCPDVSGSMSSPVTGGSGAPSAVRCIDVAGLVSAAILRRNPNARVLPFENDVVQVGLNARDSIMTNAQKLAAVGGGGTNCSAPLVRLNKERAKVDVVIFVSDNQSWMDSTAVSSWRSTGMMDQFEALRNRNPGIKLICIDIQPYGTTQAKDSQYVLNVGGFSDEVFSVIHLFTESKGKTHWTDVINGVNLQSDEASR